MTEQQLKQFVAAITRHSTAVYAPVVIPLQSRKAAVKAFPILGVGFLCAAVFCSMLDAPQWLSFPLGLLGLAFLWVGYQAHGDYKEQALMGPPDEPHVVVMWNNTTHSFVGDPRLQANRPAGVSASHPREIPGDPSCEFEFVRLRSLPAIRVPLGEKRIEIEFCFTLDHVRQIIQHAPAGRYVNLRQAMRVIVTATAVELSQEQPDAIAARSVSMRLVWALRRIGIEALPANDQS